MTIQCKVCGAGELRKRRIYRMSGVVVLIGYILLIPAIIGIAVGALMTVTGVGLGVSRESMMDSEKNAAASKLREAGIDEVTLQEVLDSKALSEDRLAALTVEQRDAVRLAQTKLGAADVVTGAGSAATGGTGLCLAVTSLVGGLLGYLLTMKKRVLKCSTCGASIAAD